MDNKKKCGKVYFSLLLGFLFIVLFGMFSECYALTPSNDINSEFANKLFDKLGESLQYTTSSNYLSAYQSDFNSFRQHVNVNDFVTFWNNLLDTSYFPYLENIVFIKEKDNNAFSIVSNNNTIGNSLNNFSLGYYMNSNDFYVYKDYWLNSSNSFSTGNWIRFTYSSDGTFSSTHNQQNRSTSYFVNAFNSQYQSKSNIVFSQDSSTCYIYGVFSITPQSINICPQISSDFHTGSFYWNTNVIDYDFNPPSPEPPSGDIGDLSGDILPGGTITNPSGEVTGKVDLTNIENGIDNINQNLNNIDNKIPTSGDMQSIISGETSKITGVLTDSADDLIDNTTITSGDIDEALGFEIADDPYSNFWLTLTNNLKTALLGSKRSIDISFQGRTWTISLDEYLVLPSWLTIILIPFSTCFFTFMIVRQWKHIFDKLSSGNVDSILQENSEERNF